MKETKASKLAKAKGMVHKTALTPEEQQWFISELLASWWGTLCPHYRDLISIQPTINPKAKAQFGKDADVFLGTYADGDIEYMGYSKPFKTTHEYIHKQLRNAVTEQLHVVRTRGCDVDHGRWSFTKLVTFWIAENESLTLLTLLRKCHKRDLDDWTQWHQQHWEPQNLTKEEHLSKTTGEYEKFWNKQTKHYWQWKYGENNG